MVVINYGRSSTRRSRPSSKPTGPPLLPRILLIPHLTAKQIQATRRGVTLLVTTANTAYIAGVRVRSGQSRVFLLLSVPSFVNATQAHTETQQLDRAAGESCDGTRRLRVAAQLPLAALAAGWIRETDRSLELFLPCAFGEAAPEVRGGSGWPAGSRQG